MSVALTLLYAPGVNEKISRKALNTSADIVVLDLEDAVVPTMKGEAREVIARVVNEIETNKRIQIRINQFDSDWFIDDLKLIKSLPNHMEVRAPKIESVEQVLRLKEHFPEREIHALIETPLGVENAFELAKAGVSSLNMGEADLKSNLYLAQDSSSDVGLGWARSRVINAASAAGLNPPMMSVYTNIADVQGLHESTKNGRAFGFIGRAAIHPSQLDPIKRAFAPSEEEIARAIKTLEHINRSDDSGAGVVVLPDGTFLDRAMIRAAEMTLAIASSLSAADVTEL